MTQEILEWDALFLEAKCRDLKLQALRQDDFGYWFACWRKGQKIFRTVDRRQPFTAAHDALMVAIAADVVEEKSETDLFG